MPNKMYAIAKALVGWTFRVWNRPEITGDEHIPEQGAAILASNHQAVMDSIYLPLLVDRQITFPAKSEYFTTPGPLGRARAWFFRAAGQIPVDRDATDAGQATVTAARSVLDRGDLLCIYPEGTRSPDGRLYKGRTGMARIAMATGHPVVPVAMIGSREANPIGTWLLRPAKVHIIIGEAIDPHAWAAERGLDPSDRAVMRPFTDYVMAELTDLVGEPYVEVYATDVKKSLAAGHGYPEGAEPGGELETRG
jgi:1-acyl-sn-glycerol-3-phosphate acyltransferase